MKTLLVSILIFSAYFHSDHSYDVQNCDVDFKNLSRADKTTLNQKVKTCGCPTKVLSIVEYAALHPNSNQAKKVDEIEKAGSKSAYKTLLAYRSGYAYEFKSCKRVRFWSDTGANGKLYKTYQDSPDAHIGDRLNGTTVLDNFSMEW